MRYKNMIALLLLTCLCLGLCACGGKTEPKETTASDTPETETELVTEAPETTEPAPIGEPETLSWGDWTVDVPAGFTLEGGDFFDENDPRYFSVKESFFCYFDFKADGEDLITANYEYNKKTYTNEQIDVKGTFGENEWIGFQYSDGYGGYGFEAYTTIDGEMIRVSCVGFTFDHELVNSVLSSLRHTPSTEPDNAG